ncbi:bifunctional [glutamine synthetase] adenylyltransferase/[glutamine synthetase]-adenylyl-L-tyrosine phosphorylase [Henriciella litoralis]|uniref:bifunctional [glutamine synthetase] adenylyltransferase/[glutamine synthetase]-adenylyl-L-tyrosine phosphorylase n=1 Tax=Henriciella litoralis TaxID=568102 RepID=UPI0009FBDB1E|nr:bifunctional [glutamine synthetase] adenylyltransferase/[glutamine synthetase]-adenylyl-L-tyrosine phosphorylase [Henriciella litoralis]
MLNIKPLSETAAAAFDKGCELAPYLARAAKRAPDAMEILRSQGGYALQAAAMAAAKAAGELEDIDEVMTALRRAKLSNHIAVAALDLSASAGVTEITGHLTDFANAATAAALKAALRKRQLSDAGIFMIALGKMGAFELNYSSDIDMAAFFDPAVFAEGDIAAQDLANKVIKDTMRILQETTGDGYVFRTDLRLRPDPSSTPPAVSTRMAEIYYESVGQNWERMVWIKARHVAGDRNAAAHFLDSLKPFVWRRHMDYWAIADVQAIKRMINAKSGKDDLHDKAPDVKLGPGGIREIEFFVQTQQIIMGGRNDFLRDRKTLRSLDALVAANAVEQSVADDLAGAYRVLRHVEHRIQMMEDEQTHLVPADQGKRTRLAKLCGFDDLDAFDSELQATRQLVSRHYRDLFAGEERMADSAAQGNLVFTGVDDDPGTLHTLSSLGFSNPSRVIASIQSWHRGKTPATRTERGRGLLTALLPDMLVAMSKTGEPDIAFTRFSQFFEGLRAGIQTLSMLVAEPDLLDDLVTTLAIAPRLSQMLARRPGLLEALLSSNWQEFPPSLNRGADFEGQMDDVRRWQNERAFLIGHRLLHSLLPASEAALAWTDLADTCISLMADAAAIETARKYGPQPGQWAVGALGKLGGRELTAGSDLDLIIVYEADEELVAEAGHWFTKFAQRLITALSAETAEGSLYEVDMRLRPSGRAGPVAVSLKAFDRYQHEDAWTWELMALTRLRFVAGEDALGEKMEAIARHAIVTGKPPETALADARDMRQRLWRERPPGGRWDLKLEDGGLVDLEFILQVGMLTCGDETLVEARIPDAIEGLSDAGYLTDDEAKTLSHAFRFLQSLQQIQRVAVGSETTSDLFSRGLRNRLSLAADCPGFDVLDHRYTEVRKAVSEIRCKKIGPLATES